MGIVVSSGGTTKTYRYYPSDAIYVDASGNINVSGQGQQVREAWFNGVKYYPESMPPNAISVVTPPAITSYMNGDAIDYTGMVVVAYSPDGTPYDTPRYPNGVIPISELVLQSNVQAGADMGVGTDVPRGLVDYLGTAPLITTKLDFDYPEGESGAFRRLRMTTYHGDAYSNGASAGVAVFEFADPYTDGHGRRRATVQGGLFLASENQFDYTYRRGYTLYNRDGSFDSKSDGTYHTVPYGSGTLYYGFSFVYDTYNNKRIYVVAPSHPAHPGDYASVTANILNPGATYLDSVETPAWNDSPDGVTIRTPYNSVNRYPLATVDTPTMTYGKYGAYRLEDSDNYSDIPSTYNGKLNMAKVIADIAIYLLYGNITMADVSIPVSWTSPEGVMLSTSFNVSIRRHS